jgi:hypothetical protein
VESVAALPWNQWQLCRGISGRLRVESVAALPWNTHPFTDERKAQRNEQAGQGYLVVDGLFPASLYPDGINPHQYGSARLAPFDEAEGRAFQLRTGLIETPLRAYIALACMVGIPFRMFEDKTLVSPVVSHPAIDSTRHGGMGENHLHKDAQFLVPSPTDVSDESSLGPGAEITGFLVINKDAHDGGVTWVLRENVYDLMQLFDERELETLKSHIFFYEPAYHVNDTKGLARFPIFYRDGRGEWRLRFSGKIRSYMARKWTESDGEHRTMNREYVLDLLDRVHRGIADQPNRCDILLETGQIMFFNTLVTMHGRGKVKDTNRLLAHVFIRVPHSGSSKNANEYMKGVARGS